MPAIDLLERHHVFRRLLSAIFTILFIHMHFSVFALLRSGFLSGDIFMSVYVAAMTGGFVALVKELWE